MVVFNFQALKGEDMTVYGDGKQTRFFQCFHDLIDGLIALMNSDDSPPIYVSTFKLATGMKFTVGEFLGFSGKLLRRLGLSDVHFRGISVALHHCVPL